MLSPKTACCLTTLKRWISKGAIEDELHTAKRYFTEGNGVNYFTRYYFKTKERGVVTEPKIVDEELQISQRYVLSTCGKYQQLVFSMDIKAIAERGRELQLPEYEQFSNHVNRYKNFQLIVDDPNYGANFLNSKSGYKALVDSYNNSVKKISSSDN